MDEMKTCGSCESQNAGDALYCIKCGASLGAIGGPVGVAPPPPPGVPYGPMPPPGMYTGSIPPPSIHAGPIPPPGMPAAGYSPHPGTLPPGFVAMPRPLPTDAMAIASLVLSIAGLFSCLIFLGIPAVILGYVAKKNIRESGDTIGGDPFATAGLIIGWIEIGLMVFLIVLFIIAVISDSGNAMMALF